MVMAMVMVVVGWGVLCVYFLGLGHSSIGMAGVWRCFMVFSGENWDCRFGLRYQQSG
jgi:hypothetical protein